MDPVLETIKQCQQMLDEQTIGKARQAARRCSSRGSGWRAWRSSWSVTNKIFQQFVGNAKSG